MRPVLTHQAQAQPTRRSKFISIYDAVIVGPTSDYTTSNGRANDELKRIRNGQNVVNRSTILKGVRTAITVTRSTFNTDDPHTWCYPKIRGI